MKLTFVRPRNDHRIDEQEVVSSTHGQRVMVEAEDDNLGIDDRGTTIGVVELGVPRVDSHLVVQPLQVVAAEQQKLPPPQQAARDYEVLLLRFAAEQPPTTQAEGVVSHAEPPGDCQVVASLIQSCILDWKPIIKQVNLNF